MVYIANIDDVTFMIEAKNLWQDKMRDDIMWWLNHGIVSIPGRLIKIKFEEF